MLIRLSRNGKAASQHWDHERGSRTVRAENGAIVPTQDDEDRRHINARGVLRVLRFVERALPADLADTIAAWGNSKS